MKRQSEFDPRRVLRLVHDKGFRQAEDELGCARSTLFDLRRRFPFLYEGLDKPSALSHVPQAQYMRQETIASRKQRMPLRRCQREAEPAPIRSAPDSLPPKQKELVLSDL